MMAGAKPPIFRSKVQQTIHYCEMHCSRENTLILFYQGTKTNLTGAATDPFQTS